MTVRWQFSGSNLPGDADGANQTADMFWSVVLPCHTLIKPKFPKYFMGKSTVHRAEESTSGCSRCGCGEGSLKEQSRIHQPSRILSVISRFSNQRIFCYAFFPVRILNASTGTWLRWLRGLCFGYTMSLQHDELTYSYDRRECAWGLGGGAPCSALRY